MLIAVLQGGGLQAGGTMLAALILVVVFVLAVLLYGIYRRLGEIRDLWLVRESAPPRPLQESAQPQPAEQGAPPQPLRESAAPHPGQEPASPPPSQESLPPRAPWHGSVLSIFDEAPSGTAAPADLAHEPAADRVETERLTMPASPPEEVDTERVYTEQVYAVIGGLIVLGLLILIIWGATR